MDLTLSQTQNFDSSKLKEFADEKFNFDKNGRKFSKWKENTVGKGKIAHYEHFFLFLQCFQKNCTADSSKLKEFADDKFSFDENGRKFSKWIENTVAKVKIASYEQFFLFPQCFQKNCTADT